MDGWQQFWEVVDQFKLENGDYDLRISGQPKERAFNRRSKIKTRNWESVVSEAAAEDAPEVLPTGSLGLRVLFMSGKCIGDLSNLIKSLEDALNRRAYKDDRQIDMLHAARIYGPDVPDRILVKVLERQNGQV